MLQMLHRLLTWQRPLWRDAFYQKISKKTFLFYNTILFTKLSTLQVKRWSTMHKNYKNRAFHNEMPYFLLYLYSISIFLESFKK